MLSTSSILLGRTTNLIGSIKISARAACRSATKLGNSPIDSTSPKRITNINKSKPEVAVKQIQLDSHKYCVQNVKKYDYENYLAALCIEDGVLKRIVFALRAFNVELSLIRDSTTDSDRAKVRFHFWSKLIDEIVRRNLQNDPDQDRANAYYNQTPVARELLDLFYLIDVDQEIQQYLRDLIGARLSSKVLGYKQFENLDELELYCLKSNGSLYQLSWRLNVQLHNDWPNSYELTPNLKSLADDLGKAHGLSNIIRGIPYNANKNCCYIPNELLDSQHLTRRDFLGRSFDAEKMKPVVRVLAQRCHELIDRVKSDSAQLPNQLRQMYLPRVSIESNLKRLKKSDYNVCDPRVTQRNGLLPLNMKLVSMYYKAPIF